jgi:SP family facilitated glucose transporter-like MFS transporter 1
MTVVAVPLMDLAGRRLLLLAPMVVMIIDFIVITVCLILKANLPDLPGVAYVTVACVIIYVIAFAVGLGPIPMMIGAELFRQGPRPKAMAVASVVNWVGTFIIALSFASVAKATGEYVFVIFLLFVVAFVVFTYFYVPETKNKTIEEIAAQFSPGGHLEVEEVDYNDVDESPPAAAESCSGDGGEHELVTLNFGGKRPAE